MIEYAVVPGALVAGEIAPNIAWQYQDSEDPEGQINIDWDYYLSLGPACQVVTARSDGRLIGYSIFVISTSSRQKHVLEAWNEGLFVEREFRGAVGPRLMKESDAFLKSIGVKQSHFVNSTPRMARLMRRNGMEPTHTIWSKKYE